MMIKNELCSADQAVQIGCQPAEKGGGLHVYHLCPLFEQNLQGTESLQNVLGWCIQRRSKFEIVYAVQIAAKGPGKDFAAAALRCPSDKGPAQTLTSLSKLDFPSPRNRLKIGEEANRVGRFAPSTPNMVGGLPSI